MKSFLTASVLLGAILVGVGSASAWDRNKYRESHGDWSETIGKRRISMGTWGWSKVGSGAWLHIHYNTGDNFNKWYLSFDLKDTSAYPWDVKAYTNVTQGWIWASDFTPSSGLPKKVDSNLKSKATFKATNDWTSTGAGWNMMIETFGHEGTSGGNPPAFEVMIWGNYGGSSHGTEVTVDGTKWLRDINWAHSDGQGGYKQKILRYARKSKTSSFSANIKPFLDNGEVGKRHNGTWRTVYLSHISCGFEIYRGNMGWNITTCSMTP